MQISSRRRRNSSQVSDHKKNTSAAFEKNHATRRKSKRKNNSSAIGKYFSVQSLKKTMKKVMKINRVITPKEVLFRKIMILTLLYISHYFLSNLYKLLFIMVVITYTCTNIVFHYIYGMYI